jgi:hypothetical protein
MKKRRILYAAAFLFIMWAAQSCEGEKCKFCKMITTDNVTGDVTEGFETEYCGAALIAIKAKGATTVGNSTTTWECR